MKAIASKESRYNHLRSINSSKSLSTAPDDLSADHTANPSPNPTPVHTHQPKSTGDMFKFIGLILILVLVVQATSNLLQKPICHFRECCHPNDGTGYINYEKGAEKLLENIKTKVFGQPLIVEPIYRSIRAHLSSDNPPRPLVMYFSGWTGTGKTYVAKLIASSLYKEGMNSRFVKYISSSYHFPIKIEGEHEISIQRQRLRDLIKETVSKCERSLIILDELDKLPSGVIDSLQPLLDYLDDIDGVRYNKAIFIFLSNTGAETLNTLAYKMYTEGKERKDLSSKDIEGILIKESFNESGGLRKSSLLQRHSIGVFVPFLPLERQHVKYCIKNEIDNQYVIPDDLDKLIDEIADEIIFFPEDSRLYSKSGCKGVRDKVINYIGPPVYLGQTSSDKYSRTDL